jgi:hypothetical protein
MLATKGVVVSIAVATSMSRRRASIFAPLLDAMPRLSTSTTSALKNDATTPVAAPVDSPTPTRTREKNFHRLYTTDEDEEPKWERKSSNHVHMPRLTEAETGFNNDGAIKVPDAPRVAGFNPLEQMFRWPDGSLRKEYPPRNPYVVAARRKAARLVHFCRITVGVMWCAHARYLTEKLGIHPEVNDEGEFYGFDPAKTDPLRDPEHAVNQDFAAGGSSYDEIKKEEEAEFESMLVQRFEDVQSGEANKSRFANENVEGPGTFVPFRCKVAGETDPVENAFKRTGLDEIE